MPKLVVLSEGLTGQSYELKVDKTTIGRVDDNTFQIAQPSVSSHHCEVLLKGNDVVVKDLGSTNGTFINNQQVTTEAVIKPGQILRLGDVEIRLESPGSAAKKSVDSTMVIQRGVSLQQLEQGPQNLDTAKQTFTRRKNKGNLWFIVVGIVILLAIAATIVYAFSILGAKSTH